MFKPKAIRIFEAVPKQLDERGCLNWMAPSPDGYGRFKVSKRHGALAHRIAYYLAFGAFDPELKVCHKCDNPSCLNPAHLFLGTQGDNLRDMTSKGRNGKQILTKRKAELIRGLLASVKKGTPVRYADRLIGDCVGIGEYTVERIRYGNTRL